ncbi:MAG: hypothetical protein HYZ54_02475 [Ignavibacteriae bacterium]|nr:hypothetical protein [Ignavibacteriota bacterium]
MNARFLRFSFCFLLVLFLVPTGLRAQIITNKGTVITGSNGSTMWVNGTFDNINGGEITFQGASFLQVNGEILVQSGIVSLLDSSTAIVTENCLVSPGSQVLRYGNGTLSVYKLYNNQGSLDNKGTVEIGNIALSSTIGQNFHNDAVATFLNKGMVRFLADSGRFSNYQTDILKVNNDGGIIEMRGIYNRFTEGNGAQPFLGDNNSTALGSRWNFRIGGLVRYAHSADSQIVQSRYFTDLEMDNSARKLIPTDVYVGGKYNVTGTSGNRNYTGTFHYDGSLSQYIYPENGATQLLNRYYNVDLLVSDQSKKSNKFVDSNSIARLDAVLTSDSLAPLFVDGQIHLGNLGVDTSITFGTIDVRNDGLFNMGSRPAVVHADVSVHADSKPTPATFQSPIGAGDVHVANTATLRLAATNGVLRLAQATNLFVTGDFVNSGDGTNVHADSTSTVIFNGFAGQGIEKTISTNPYGNVTTLREKNARDNIFMAGNLKVEAGNVNMISGRALTMIDSKKSATYVGGLEEVVGAMRRLNLPIGTEPYTFNNVNTTVAFLSAKSTLPPEMTFTVTPLASPGNPALQFTDTTDANRRITVNYTGNEDWEAIVRAGYKVNEIGSQVDETHLEFFEATAASAKNLNTSLLNPSNQYVRKSATNAEMGYVELPGIRPTKPSSPYPVPTLFASGNDLLLRYSPGNPYLILSARVLLEGPYRDGSMAYDLRTLNLIDSIAPNIMPYNLDTNRLFEKVRVMPDSIVDWATVEVRSEFSGGNKTFRNCFIRSDGMLVDLDGKSPVALPLSSPDSFYVVVRHRNHLAVMTSSPVLLRLKSDSQTGLETLDMTNETIILGGAEALKAIALRPDNSIIYGMPAGDYNTDGIIDNVDYDRIWSWRDYEGYWNEDTDLNGIVTTRDFNISWNNANMKKKTVVP